MTGVYLSGTGNTRHCVKKLLSLLDESARAVPLESPSAVEAIQGEEWILLAYPTQFSNAPIFVRDFIKTHAALWQGKKVFCLTTMGLFSGDGTGCTARLLKKRGADVVGGLQIRMPDAVCDSKALKKSLAENREIVAMADGKIEAAAESIKKGVYPQEGLRLVDHFAGLLGQRLWFYGKTLHYSRQLNIHDSCIGCGLCAKQCPMGNLRMERGRPVPGGHCTMCYRCVSFCPQKAITLLGKAVVEQCRFESYRV